MKRQRRDPASGGESSKMQGTPGVTGPVTLEMFYSNNTYGREQTVATFVERYPHVTLNATPVGTFTDAQEKVFTAAAAGTLPDVFWSHGANTATFAHQRGVARFTPARELQIARVRRNDAPTPAVS